MFLTGIFKVVQNKYAVLDLGLKWTFTYNYASEVETSKPSDSYVPKTRHYGVSLFKNWHNCTQIRLTD